LSRSEQRGHGRTDETDRPLPVRHHVTDQSVSDESEPLRSPLYTDIVPA